MNLRRTRRHLDHALSYPEAWEDHPWEESVAKVGKKVFVFFGAPSPDQVGLTVKLPNAASFALTFPFAEPAGYGLGKAGWVMCTFSAGDEPPIGMLEDWIDESYRAVAPKKLINLLDAS